MESRWRSWLNRVLVWRNVLGMTLLRILLNLMRLRNVVFGTYPRHNAKRSLPVEFFECGGLAGIVCSIAEWWFC